MSKWALHLPFPVRPPGYGGQGEPSVAWPMTLEVPEAIDRLEPLDRRAHAMALFHEAQRAAIRELGKRGQKLMAWAVRHMGQRRFLDEAIKRFNATRPQGTVPVPAPLAGNPAALLAELVKRGLLERVSEEKKADSSPAAQNDKTEVAK